MSTIPLPALNVQPPAPQEGAMDQYKNVVQLKSLLGNQQTQQLQQTALAQQNEERQSQLDNQKAVRKAMLEFDPKTQNMVKDLPDLIIKNGGEPGTALDMRSKLIAGENEMRSYKKGQQDAIGEKNAHIIQALEPITQEKDPNVAAKSWTDTLNKLQEDNVLTPEEAAPHAQYPGADAAKIYLNTLHGSQQVLGAAKEAADAREKNAQAQGMEIKNNLAKNAKPEDFLNEVDRALPGKDNAALRMRTRSQVQFALDRGDSEGATKAITEAVQQVNSIEKEIDPRVQRGKINVAAAEGKARADAAAATARGSNAALSEVPPHLVPPATAAYEKAADNFAQAHQASQNLHDFLSMAKAGNKEAVKIVPLQGALEITTAQGVHRINRTEVDQFAGAGSLYDKLAGKIGGALTGKSITDSVLNDMQALQNKIDTNAKTLHANKVKGINKTYGSKFEPMNYDDDTGGDATTSKGASKPTSYADQFPVHQ